MIPPLSISDMCVKDDEMTGLYTDAMENFVN